MVTAAGLPLISAVKWNKPELSTTPESSSQNVLLQSNFNCYGSSSSSSAIVSKTKEVPAIYIYIYGGTLNSLKTERKRHLTVPK
jgi:hypothetical protein